MSKAIALTYAVRAASVERSRDIARSAIVVACSAALILAGQAIPTIG